MVDIETILATQVAAGTLLPANVPAARATLLATFPPPANGPAGGFIDIKFPDGTEYHATVNADGSRNVVSDTRSPASIAALPIP